MWTIFKVFIKLVTVLLLLFMFWVFGHETYSILALCPGIEPVPSALEGKVLTTGRPGKSHSWSLSHNAFFPPKTMVIAFDLGI